MKGSVAMKKKYNHYIKIDDFENAQDSFIRLKALVTIYMIRYKKATINLQFNKASTLTDEELEESKLYVKYIDTVLSNISTFSKEFILNEFIKHYNNPKWWTTKYNRSTFFKMRKAAFREFLIYVT